MPISNERIVWIDCEMTGLDIKNDALIEVAALVTDSELNILGDGVDVVIKPEDAALAQMNDFVRDMHTRSGLLKELPHGKSMAEADGTLGVLDDSDKQTLGFFRNDQYSNEAPDPYLPHCEVFLVQKFLGHMGMVPAHPRGMPYRHHASFFQQCF